MHDTPKDPFTDSALKKVPIDWISQLTGQVIVAVHAAILSAADINHIGGAIDLASLASFFW